jgi:hypothetical protein
MKAQQLGVRWTIGDVSERGFEALMLSIRGASNMFGPETAYGVCVNTIPVEKARELVGHIPADVSWHAANIDELPNIIKEHVDEGMSEGVSWKFAPLRLFPDRYELSLDNDCIMWEAPRAIRLWLEHADPDRCVVAEDVRTCFGQFEPLCGSEPRNTGIRGLPPRFDFEGALRNVLARHPVRLTSETDEQGLQYAALSLAKPPFVVSVQEVTICSPFPPHIDRVGSCGAHFVGLNVRQLPWQLDGRAATEYIRDNWLRHRHTLYERVGAGAAVGP